MSNKVLSQVSQALAQLNPNEVRAMAERPFKIGIVAQTEAGARAMARFLSRESFSVSRRAQEPEMVEFLDENDSGEGYDILMIEEGLPKVPNSFTFHADDPQATVAEILTEKQEFGLPLARSFPVFRKAVTERIVSTIAKENALFSIVSALPDVFPLASLPWSVAEFASDTAFLTANQLRMAFMLAGASDRPIGYREQKSEVASVIAGAFGWRSIARELVGKIPLGGGVIPKAAIAYGGTWAVGYGLERLYSVGYAMGREERKRYYEDGFARGKAIATKLYETLRRR